MPVRTGTASLATTLVADRADREPLAPIGADAVANLNPIFEPDQAEPAAKVHDLGRPVETAAQRVQRLQLEARTLAKEQVESLADDLNAMASRAAEIAAGGSVYPVG